MGIWSWDIIGCDANLELAMDFLTCAGIGPPDYAVRRKSFMIVLSATMSAKGREGKFLGRHTPEEYTEFFGVLDASASRATELDAHMKELFLLANSVQTVFESGDDGGTPVGHAMHVLGLILMQAGVMREAFADIVLSIPICAASVAGENKEREAHEERYKAAIRDYKSSLVVEPSVLLCMHTREDASGVHVATKLETAPLYRGDAVKYSPRDWHNQMVFVHDGDVPATVTKVPFEFCSRFRQEMRQAQPGTADYETAAARGKVEREKLSQAYMRDPDEVAPQAKLVGKRVRLQGLEKRPEFNGLHGTVAAFNHATERFAVEVDNVSRMALKQANLVEL